MSLASHGIVVIPSSMKKKRKYRSRKASSIAKSILGAQCETDISHRPLGCTSSSRYTGTVCTGDNVLTGECDMRTLKVPLTYLDEMSNKTLYSAYSKLSYGTKMRMQLQRAKKLFASAAKTIPKVSRHATNAHFVEYNGVTKMTMEQSNTLTPIVLSYDEFVAGMPKCSKSQTADALFFRLMNEQMPLNGIYTALYQFAHIMGCDATGPILLDGNNPFTLESTWNYHADACPHGGDEYFTQVTTVEIENGGVGRRLVNQPFFASTGQKGSDGLFPADSEKAVRGYVHATYVDDDDAIDRMRNREMSLIRNAAYHLRQATFVYGEYVASNPNATPESRIDGLSLTGSEFRSIFVMSTMMHVLYALIRDASKDYWANMTQPKPINTHYDIPNMVFYHTAMSCLSRIIAEPAQSTLYTSAVVKSASETLPVPTVPTIRAVLINHTSSPVDANFSNPFNIFGVLYSSTYDEYARSAPTLAAAHMATTAVDLRALERTAAEAESGTRPAASPQTERTKLFTKSEAQQYLKGEEKSTAEMMGQTRRTDTTPIVLPLAPTAAPQSQPQTTQPQPPSIPSNSGMSAVVPIEAPVQIEASSSTAPLVSAMMTQVPDAPPSSTGSVTMAQVPDT